jgi:hypothetical protein
VRGTAFATVKPSPSLPLSSGGCKKPLLMCRVKDPRDCSLASIVSTNLRAMPHVCLSSNFCKKNTMRIKGLAAYYSEVALFSQVAAYSTDVGCSLASPAISRTQKTALNSAGSLSKHPGEPMKNIIFALCHPIKAWRHYSAMRGFDKLFSNGGKVPF